tara:strand:- start:43356 stop:43922 length:567 start_codon:yes stop_codon:yes gene_type:complete
MSNDNILRFSLCVPLGRQTSVLHQLHLFAREQMFRGVSKILTFEGKDCQVGPKDPMAALKRQAQGIALANGRLLSFLPERFSGFGCQLPNKRLMFVGFAQYPTVVTAPGGQDFVTPWDGLAFWHSTVVTLDPRFTDRPDDCSESHRMACDLLRQADSMDALRVVEDSTGYYHRPGQVEVGCEEPLGTY